MKWLAVAFAGLAVLAAVLTHLPFSDAAFTSASSTGVRAATAPLSSNTIRVAAGDEQTAGAGAEVATDPAVLVTDTGGNPVAGVEVAFTVTAGDGSVSGARATTDATGVAAVGAWRLGTTAGTNELTATAAGLSEATVVFTATGVAGPQTGYLVTAGNERPVAGSAVTVTAQLVDQHGNPIATPGVRVTWSKTGSGGSITSSSTTGATGRATATLATSTVAGRTYTVKATSSSPARTGTSPSIVTVAGAPSKLTISAGNQQTAAAGTTVAVAPRVLVRDANNNPVPDADVSFTVTGGGGRLEAPAARTDASGLASAGAWTLGTVAGGNSVSATVAGLPGTAVTLTAVATAGPAAGYVVTASTYTPRPGVMVIVRAQLADQYGNAVKTAGVALAWSLSGPDGVLTGANLTNQGGYASGTLIVGRTPGATCTVSASSSSPGAVTGTSAPIVVTP